MHFLIMFIRTFIGFVCVCVCLWFPACWSAKCCMHALRWTLGMVANVEEVVVRLLLLVLPHLLCLPWHAVLLNEGPVNEGLNELCQRDWYSIELEETCNQCRKS